MLIEHPGGGRGRGRAGSRSDAAGDPQGLCHPGRRRGADRATALSIFQHLRERLAPFKRVRRLEFAELPKTISGKIRRVELRQRNDRASAGTREPANSAKRIFPN